MLCSSDTLKLSCCDINGCCWWPLHMLQGHICHSEAVCLGRHKGIAAPPLYLVSHFEMAE